MLTYGIQTEYEPTGIQGRCDIRACAYPGLGFKILDHWRGLTESRSLCGWHFIIGSCPFSMEYEDADALLASYGHKHCQFYSPAAIFAMKPYAGYSWRQRLWMKFAKAEPIRPTPEIRPKTQVWKPEQKPLVEWSGETHGLEAIYNFLGSEGRFGETFRMLSLVYSSCGEKVPKASLAPLGKLPTCAVCRRIVEARKPMPAKPRPRITTQPKEKDDALTFEELVAYGLVGFDPDAFANRRNWGERSGRAWNDRTQGVQRDNRLRWDRGGVNRKRG